MKTNNVCFFTNRVEIAEHKEGENLFAKFVLCSFDTNKNGVRLERSTIENWMGTIVNQPLQGRLKRDPVSHLVDFSGHNLKVVYNEDGEREVILDTDSYGVFTSVAIEVIDGQEMLVANAEIWARYANVCKLIISRVETGTLQTSWEITVGESHIDDGVKVITDGKLIGLAMLGRSIEPAYDCSRLLECASDEYDEEFTEAMAADYMIAMQANKEGEDMKKEDIITSVEDTELEESQVEAEVNENPKSAPEEAPDTSKCGGDGGSDDEKKKEKAENEPEEEKPEEEDKEEKAEDTEKSEAETETSALTEWDLRERLSRACGVKLNADWCWVAFLFPADSLCWCRYDGAPTELDYAQFAYSVDGETVSVGEPEYITLSASPRQMNASVVEKSSALINADARIKELQAQVDGLSEYKEAFEKAEAEKQAAEKERQIAELKSMALKSGQITEKEISEDTAIKELISSLNADGLKILIADRILASMNEDKPEVETSEASVHVSASIEDETPASGVSVVRAWLKRDK